MVNLVINTIINHLLWCSDSMPTGIKQMTDLAWKVSMCEESSKLDHYSPSALTCRWYLLTVMMTYKHISTACKWFKWLWAYFQLHNTCKTVKILWLQLLICEYFLGFLWKKKLNISGLWSKQDVWERHLELLETMIDIFHHFMDQPTNRLFGIIIDRLIFIENNH